MQLNFYLSKENRNGLCEIRLYIRHCQSCIIIPTNEQIEKTNWDSVKQTAKRQYTGHPELNEFLTNFKNHYEKLIRQFRAENITADFDDIKKFINEQNKKKETKSIYDLIDLYVKHNSEGKNSRYASRFTLLKNELKEYSHIEPINIKSINQLFVDKFKTFLTDKGNSPATVQSKVKNLKVFLNYLKSREIVEGLKPENIKVQKAQGDSAIALSNDEIDLMWNLDLKDNPRRAEARDLFLFSVFTCQRYGDCVNFSNSNVEQQQINGKNVWFWNIRQQKTGTSVSIPLNSRARQIIEKYNGILPRFDVKGVIHGKLSKYIREIAFQCGEGFLSEIQVFSKGKQHTGQKYQFLHFHNGRDSGICRLLRAGMQPQKVMELSGHKSYNEFKKYIIFYRQDMSLNEIEIFS